MILPGEEGMGEGNSTEGQEFTGEQKKERIRHAEKVGQRRRCFFDSFEAQMTKSGTQGFLAIAAPTSGYSWCDLVDEDLKAKHPALQDALLTLFGGLFGVADSVKDSAADNIIAAAKACSRTGKE